MADDPTLRRLMKLKPLASHGPALGLEGDFLTASDQGAPGPPSIDDEIASTRSQLADARRAVHQSAPDPETVHVDQQMTAAAKVPEITPAAGSTTTAFDPLGMIGEMASGAVGMLGHGFGPELPELSIAHAANPKTGAAPSQPIMDNAERIRRHEEINSRNRATGTAEPAAGGGHSIDAAAATRHVPSEVPLDNMYDNSDLAIEHAAGKPSRGGYVGGQDLKDVAYLPDSVLEEAANRRQLAEAQTPPGEISPGQRGALKMAGEASEIKFAAMDKIIDQERDRRIAEAQSAVNVPPERRAAAIKFAEEDASEKKLRNRQIGMAGWPRRQADDRDAFGDTDTSYGGQR